MLFLPKDLIQPLIPPAGSGDAAPQAEAERACSDFDAARAFSRTPDKHATHRRRHSQLERAVQLHNRSRALRIVDQLCLMGAKAERILADAAQKVTAILQLLRDRGIDKAEATSSFTELLSFNIIVLTSVRPPKSLDTHTTPGRAERLVRHRRVQAALELKTRRTAHPDPAQQAASQACIGGVRRRAAGSRGSKEGGVRRQGQADPLPLPLPASKATAARWVLHLGVAAAAGSTHQPLRRCIPPWAARGGSASSAGEPLIAAFGGGGRPVYLGGDKRRARLVPRFKKTGHDTRELQYPCNDSFRGAPFASLGEVIEYLRQVAPFGILLEARPSPELRRTQEACTDFKERMIAGKRAGYEQPPDEVVARVARLLQAAAKAAAGEAAGGADPAGPMEEEECRAPLRVSSPAGSLSSTLD
ncbi:hypothetical protein D9Q98_009090 [Chlorella vulgaris]|uniref:Uncharacterized protein n=1 Tax=Chlorella vulgaris TaxID=3077 RepID=A0A9D4TH73_CHLVU|nr:hypothetical protein D9Q98_009090 [Chlorella vulgaris]